VCQPRQSFSAEKKEGCEATEEAESRTDRRACTNRGNTHSSLLAADFFLHSFSHSLPNTTVFFPMLRPTSLFPHLALLILCPHFYTPAFSLLQLPFIHQPSYMYMPYKLLLAHQYSVPPIRLSFQCYTVQCYP